MTVGVHTMEFIDTAKIGIFSKWYLLTGIAKVLHLLFMQGEADEMEEKMRFAGVEP